MVEPKLKNATKLSTKPIKIGPWNRDFAIFNRSLNDCGNPRTQNKAERHNNPGPWLYLKISCSIPAKDKKGMPMEIKSKTNSPKYGLPINVWMNKDNNAQITNPIKFNTYNSYK